MLGIGAVQPFKIFFDDCWILGVYGAASAVETDADLPKRTLFSTIRIIIGVIFHRLSSDSRLAIHRLIYIMSRN